MNKLLGGALVFGIGGWLAENLFIEERYSSAFDNHKVPFLPVYAIGGMTVILTHPHISEFNPLLRAGIYAAELTAIEYVAGQLDRRLMNKCSWDYSDKQCNNINEGIVDLPHAVLWGGLGLITEKIID